MGRQTVIWGSKSASKTSFVLQLIAKAQARGLSCVFFDVEGTFDATWAKRLGVDTDDLRVVSEVKATNDFGELAIDFMNAGVDLMVVDSISVLVPGSYFQKEGELKELDNTKQIGSEARDMANLMRMLNYANHGTTLILISQERNQITTYGARKTPTGGKAVEFYSTSSIQLFSSETDKNQIKKRIPAGDSLIEYPVGRKVDWRVTFNKAGPPSQAGSYDFYYYGDKVGIDNIGEIVDVATSRGVIQQAGSWFVIGEQRIQGKTKLVDLLSGDQELYDKIVGELNGQA